ncbi:MAG: HEAT repeat domain-containing protein [Pyrinomonadaceae bacterium]
MTRKLITALICALMIGPVSVAQTPAPEPHPVVSVRPAITIAPDVRVDLSGINIVPAFRFEMPEITIPPIPPINIDIPDIQFDGPGFWFDDDQTEREELKQTYSLSAGARVELSNIDGPVRIEPTDGSAEVRILSYAWGETARKLAVESTGNSLTIRGPEANARDYDDTRHSVTLKLPRRVELTVNNARDTVHVGDFDGPVRLNGVSGGVSIAQAAGSADISRVSGSVVVNMARVGSAGIRVQDVSGTVSVRFLEDLNADLQTANIKGKVYVEVPNVAVQGEMKNADFRAKIGTGGAALTISDVTGTVRLARGRSVSELLTALKAGTERSSVRAATVRDLAMHVSQPQARAALIETLQAGENSNIDMTASRALANYANEPDVRAVFIKAVDASHNDSTRATIMRALARNYAGDRSVRDLLLRALATDKSNQVRQTAISALAKNNLDDADVQRALMEALRSDTNDSVRLRAAGALAKRTDNGEIYALLVETAKSDRKRSIRARALDGLAPRLGAHPELRPLFVGYLNDESISMQYYALKGLVGLNDPALKQQLVDKSREIILAQGRRYWNDQLVLSTLILLRKLDPQEADRALEQLGADRDRRMRY